MTALANGVRKLTGYTGKQSITDMISNLQEVDTYLTQQEQLITQLEEKIQNLPSAGGSATQCGITISVSNDYSVGGGTNALNISYLMYQNNGEIIIDKSGITLTADSNKYLHQIICDYNTPVYMRVGPSQLDYTQDVYYRVTVSQNVGIEDTNATNQNTSETYYVLSPSYSGSSGDLVFGFNKK